MASIIAHVRKVSSVNPTVSPNHSSDGKEGDDDRCRPTTGSLLVDHSGKTVGLTLWGAHSGRLDGAKGTAVVLQHLRTQTSDGRRNLTTTYNSVINENSLADDRDKLHLTRWWSTFDPTQDFEEILLERVWTSSPDVPTLTGGQ